MLPLQARVDLGAMAIKGYSAFPKAPALLAPSDCLVSYQDTLGEGLTPLQRYSQCILQPLLTGQSFPIWKVISRVKRFEEVEDIKWNTEAQTHPISKEDFQRCVQECWMLRETILKKINVSSIVQFCLGKYSYSLDIFLMWLM